MEWNESILEEAREMARQVELGSLKLPAPISGFPDLCLASAHDTTVIALTGIVSKQGISYKIGSRGT
jgi:hypothetical protein